VAFSALAFFFRAMQADGPATACGSCSHEVAHIERCDWLVQVLAEAARTVYWFNPLFWLLCRRLRAESEHACDDVVLNAGINANDYAAALAGTGAHIENFHSGLVSRTFHGQATPVVRKYFVRCVNG
jgi:beta-lactamase regulating signal transducer with metallopeptidase domain